MKERERSGGDAGVTVSGVLPGKQDGVEAGGAVQAYQGRAGPARGAGSTQGRGVQFGESVGVKILPLSLHTFYFGQQARRRADGQFLRAFSY